MAIYRLGEQEPAIHAQTWIAPNAVVVGDVRLARNVSVWWNATLRGDHDPIIIGENSNVQDGAVLHTDDGAPLTIARNVTIGHLVMAHGCTIGEGSLIGIGAILLNHAVIGKNSIVGANTLIPEGKVYPDRSLIIGSPGKVVRSLSDEELAKLALSAPNYVANWQRYLSTLQAL
ncbi:MAG: gamma carbonic anhydrase family protein [Pseudomonadota bacterium]